jgi:hypothetical protein
MLLVTGYGSETVARTCGALLAAAGTLGLYSCIVLTSQPEPQSWMRALAEPFNGLGRASLRSGTILVVVLALAITAQFEIDAGLRRSDKLYRKK